MENREAIDDRVLLSIKSKAVKKRVSNDAILLPWLSLGKNSLSIDKKDQEDELLHDARDRSEDLPKIDFKKILKQADTPRISTREPVHLAVKRTAQNNLSI